VTPSALSIAGMAIILSAALYTAVRCIQPLSRAPILTPSQLTKENTSKKRAAPLVFEDSALEQGLLSADSDEVGGEEVAMRAFVVDVSKSPKPPKVELDRELEIEDQRDAPTPTAGVRHQ
jgi:hypothetical protein